MRQSRAPTASQIQTPPPPSSSTKGGNRFFGKSNLGMFYSFCLKLAPACVEPIADFRSQATTSAGRRRVPLALTSPRSLRSW